MLRCFGHVDRMDEKRLTKLNEAVVSGNAVRGRLGLRFLVPLEQVFEKGHVRSTQNESMHENFD
jgi:hypothetical protein